MAVTRKRDLQAPQRLILDAGAVIALARGESKARAFLARALELMRTNFQPTTWKACWELIVNGRSAAEVATELGISENAVYLAKGRVLRVLRRELQGLLD